MDEQKLNLKAGQFDSVADVVVTDEIWYNYCSFSFTIMVKIE